MSTQQIDVGATADDGLGDLLRDAFVKVNSNFTVTQRQYGEDTLTYAPALVVNFDSDGNFDNKGVELTGDINLTLQAGRQGLYLFRVRQDSTGGHTVTWGANVVGPPTVDGSPGATTVAALYFDGAQFYSAVPSGSAGPSPAAAAGVVPEYDSTKSYPQRSLVAYNGRLYYAPKAIPSGGPVPLPAKISKQVTVAPAVYQRISQTDHGRMQESLSPSGSTPPVGSWWSQDAADPATDLPDLTQLNLPSKTPTQDVPFPDGLLNLDPADLFLWTGDPAFEGNLGHGIVASKGLVYFPRGNRFPSTGETIEVQPPTDWTPVGAGASSGPAPAPGAATGQTAQLQEPQDNSFQQDYSFIPHTGLTWRDTRGTVRLVADKAARLALSYPEEIDTGTLVIQQDTGWTYRFVDSGRIRRRPAVTLAYGPTTPSAANPINPIDFVFTGLPAAEETTFENHSVLLDTNTGQTSVSTFKFTLQAGDGINEALQAIQAVLPPRGLMAIGADTVRDSLPAHLKVMDAFITAYSPPDPAAPITDANWQVFSDFITLPDWQAIRDLERAGEAREGMTVNVPSMNGIFSLQNGSWRQIYTENLSPHQLGKLVYDPNLPPHDRLAWQDARTDLEVVFDLADLHDRTRLPANHMTVGKLVFVESEGSVYQLIADPEQGALVGSMADWKPLFSGTRYVGRIRDLPDPATEKIADGQTFIIKQDFSGQPLYRLVTWDTSLPGRPSAAPVNLTVTVTPGATTSDPLVVDFDDAGGTPSIYERTVDYDITVSGVRQSGSLTVAANSRASQFAKQLEAALNFGAAATVSKAASVVTITPASGETIDGTPSVVIQPATPPPIIPGDWQFLNRKIWTKDTRGDADQVTDQKAGDLQFTLESEHREIKVYENNKWNTILSDDEINNRIASLSLFEGTTKEIGGTAAGAIELAELPNLWTMGSQKDLSKLSHYWVYVGAPNYEVQSAAQQKQAVLAAGGNWGDVQATPAPALPSAAGAAVRLNIEVLDQQGNSGANVEVYKTWTLRVKITRANPGAQQSPDAYHEIRVPLDGTTGGLGAADIAQLISTTWGSNTGGKVIGLQVGAWQANQEYVEFTPDADVSIDLIEQIDGGTPGIGENLGGAVLNPGDWIQVANRGGDGSGVGPAGADPDLQYVTIGGNLLTKQRADGLYSLAEWTQPDTWEQGAVVVYNGDVYRAKRAVSNQDGDPAGSPKQFSYPSGAANSLLDGTAGVHLPTTGTNGDIEVATADGTMAGGNFAFANEDYHAGDVFVYSTNPLVAGTGHTEEGYEFQSGWVKFGSQLPLPDPLTFSVRPTQVAWERVDISGGLKVAQTDADLPTAAPPGQVWIVISSATAGGKQTLKCYDTGSQQWVELGGGGVNRTVLDLTGGEEIINIGLPIGSITAYAGGAALPNGWLVADGSQYNTTTYKDLFAVLGTDTLPDLTDHFIRGGTPEAGFTQHRDTTRLPRNAFTGRTNDGGNHHHGVSHHLNDTDASWSRADAMWTTSAGTARTTNTSTAGNHNHSFSVSGGGDAETAPKHVVLLYIVKASDEAILERTT